MKNMIFHELAEAARRGEPIALGIISGVKASSPQKVGAKAIFYADGRIKGTMGGGCLEAEIQQRAIQSLRNRASSSTSRWNWSPAHSTPSMAIRLPSCCSRA